MPVAYSAHIAVKMPRKGVFVAALFLFSGSCASAADISDVFYLDAAAGPSALMLHMNNDGVDGAIANTYWGVEGRLGLCSKGPLSFCGGLDGFTSLGSASKSLSTAKGGGKTETQIQSIGGYIQAKANLGVVTVAPFAGYRQVFGDVSVKGNSGFHAGDIDSGAYYGGLETSIRFLPTDLELGTRLEYGQSTGDADFEDFNYGIASAFLRLRF